MSFFTQSRDYKQHFFLSTLASVYGTEDKTETWTNEEQE